MGDRIDLYRPQGVSDHDWDAVGALTREQVRATGPLTPARAARLMNVVSGHLAWALRRGIELRPEVVWHVDTIEHGVVDRLGHLSSSSQATYRSELRAVGEVVLGPDSCPTRQRIISRSNPEAPYSRNEVADLLSAVRGLSTPHRRENAHILFALALGGGLANGEITSLVGTDITKDSDAVTATVAHRSRSRRVPIRADWEDAVAQRAEQVGDRPMFRPDRDLIRPLDIPKFLDSLSFPYLPRLTIVRLRVTWIVGHLAAGVPINVLASAAGVQASQVARYAEFVPTMEQTDQDRLLRGQAAP